MRSGHQREFAEETAGRRCAEKCTDKATRRDAEDRRGGDAEDPESLDTAESSGHTEAFASDSTSDIGGIMPAPNLMELAHCRALRAQFDKLTKNGITEKNRDEAFRIAGRLDEAFLAAGRGATPFDDAGMMSADKDVLNYLRTGQMRNASMSTTDANGGYLVSEPLHAAMIDKVRLADPIYALATKLDLSGGPSTVQLPVKTAHGVTAHAVENDARSEQNAPEIGSNDLSCWDIYTDQRATQTLIDSVVGFERMLLAWIYDDIYEQAGVDFAMGDGINKAAGLFLASSTYAHVLSGAAGALSNTAFMSALLALDTRYRANACWLMSSATLAVVSGYALPNIADQPLVNWNGDRPTILGKPVYECGSAPTIGATTYPVAIGDISAAYVVGENLRVSVLRDPFTSVPKIRFYGLARIGGRPWDPQACVLVKANDA